MWVWLGGRPQLGYERRRESGCERRLVGGEVSEGESQIEGQPELRDSSGQGEGETRGDQDPPAAGEDREDREEKSVLAKSVRVVRYAVVLCANKYISNLRSSGRLLRNSLV